MLELIQTILLLIIALDKIKEINLNQIIYKIKNKFKTDLEIENEKILNEWLKGR